MNTNVPKLYECNMKNYGEKVYQTINILLQNVFVKHCTQKRHVGINNSTIKSTLTLFSKLWEIVSLKWLLIKFL